MATYGTLVSTDDDWMQKIGLVFARLCEREYDARLGFWETERFATVLSNGKSLLSPHEQM